MKIILRHCRDNLQASSSFDAVELAIKDDIKQGRDEFKIYDVVEPGREYKVAVVKNKDSYTTYIQEVGQAHNQGIGELG